MKKILILLSIIYSFSFGNWLSLGEYVSGSQDVYYSSDSTIAAFQFDVEGATVVSAFGGVAEEAGFACHETEITVLCFDVGGELITAGDGVLTVLILDGAASSLSNIVASDENGNTLDFVYYDALDCENVWEGGAVEDCAGECNGDAVEDECGLCEGDNSTCLGCDDIPNSGLVDDECGVCGGDADGSDCNNDGIDDVCEDEYNLGIDAGFNLGALSGDATGDGVLTVNDLIFYIDVILNGN